MKPKITFNNVKPATVSYHHVLSNPGVYKHPTWGDQYRFVTIRLHDDKLVTYWINKQTCNIGDNHAEQATTQFTKTEDKITIELG